MIFNPLFVSQLKAMDSPDQEKIFSLKNSSYLFSDIIKIVAPDSEAGDTSADLLPQNSDTQENAADSENPFNNIDFCKTKISGEHPYTFSLRYRFVHDTPYSPSHLPEIKEIDTEEIIPEEETETAVDVPEENSGNTSEFSPDLNIGKNIAENSLSSCNLKPVIDQNTPKVFTENIKPEVKLTPQPVIQKEMSAELNKVNSEEILPGKEIVKNQAVSTEVSSSVNEKEIEYKPEQKGNQQKIFTAEEQIPVELKEITQTENIKTKTLSNNEKNTPPVQNKNHQKITPEKFFSKENSESAEPLSLSSGQKTTGTKPPVIINNPADEKLKFFPDHDLFKGSENTIRLKKSADVQVELTAETESGDIIQPVKPFTNKGFTPETTSQQNPPKEKSFFADTKPLTESSDVTPVEKKYSEPPVPETLNKDIMKNELKVTRENTPEVSSSKDGGQVIQQRQFNFSEVQKVIEKPEIPVFTKTIRSEEIIKEMSLLIGKNESKAVLRLIPQELGKIRISLDIKDKIVNADIEVENESVKQTVLQNSEVLRTSLYQQGIQLASLNINLNSENKSHGNTAQRKKQSSAKGEIESSKSQIKHPRNMGYNTYEYVI
jgi:flagellar hook-length control protein FliK